jgi:hypothetical protein
MNPMMNDKRFFDLAMKAIARQATDAERAELDALLERQPMLRGEFARLQADAHLAKDVLPLVDATKASGDKLPAYARGRLQTKVRQTLGRPAVEKESDRSFGLDKIVESFPAARRKRNLPDRSLISGWRWVLGLAAATAAILIVALPMFRTPSGPLVQVAMLDTVGAVRGSETNETEILKQQWKNSIIQNFDNTDLLENWETNWPEGNKVKAKVIYNRAAGEVLVLLHKGDKTQQKTFIIEQDLATTMQEADNFIQEQTKR